MKPPFVRFFIFIASLVSLVGCGSSSSSSGVTSSTTAWMGIAVDNTANTTKLYLADYGTNSIKSVLVAGGATTSMTNASPAFNGPEGLALNGSSLYVVDAWNHAARQVTTASPYTTTLYAGTVGTSGNSDTSGTFYLPRNAVFDSNGNLYVTDSGNNTIRKIATDKTVTTIASGFNNPWGITIDNDSPQNLYITDIGTNSVKKVTLTGAVTTFAGNVGGNSGLPTNAIGTAAYFNSPLGITTDGTYLYVVDGGNNAIRRIHLVTKSVELMAGSSAGTAGNSVNATGASALLSTPYAIAFATVSGNGTLFVSDQGGTLIRKVSTTSPYAVTTFTVN